MNMRKRRQKVVHQVPGIVGSPETTLKIEKGDFIMTEMKKWIQGADIKKDVLRKKLGAKEGHDIPASKLEKAENSKNPKTRKQAALAETFKKMRKR